MNDLVFFGNIRKRFIPLDAAHVLIKPDRRKIVGIASAEKFGNTLLPAVSADAGKGVFSKAAALVALADVKIIQAKGKIFIYAEIVRAEGEIANALFPFHK